MTAVLHVIGSAAPGDITTAAAKAVQGALAVEGLPGRLVAVAVRGDCGVDALDAGELDGGPVVLHTVDGGTSVAPVLGDLLGRQVHLVHHGSRPGSDRTVLRSLRGAVTVAAGTDAAAREELRGLGFGEPVALPSRLPVGAGVADSAEVPASEHPGPYLLTVGPIADGRSLELLVDAFGQLLHDDVPSAVLSVCGPATRWYLDALLRRVVRRGLSACEVIEPADDQAVRARLDRCDVYVALQPTGYDPHLWHAASHAAVVAPSLPPTTRFVGSPGFVPVDVAPTRDHLADALRRAVTARPAAGVVAAASPGTTDLRSLLRVA